METHKWGDIQWFVILLMNVVQHCIANVETVVVYALPNFAIIEVEMCIGIVEQVKGEISHE